ncbi:hypothetical protein A2U01_0014599, partial [Trifolium medium]|nr:hypothetical protein [Trifolium medium]
MVILKNPTTELFDTDGLESKIRSGTAATCWGRSTPASSLSIAITTVLINSHIKDALL